VNTGCCLFELAEPGRLPLCGAWGRGRHRRQRLAPTRPAPPPVGWAGSMSASTPRTENRDTPTSSAICCGLRPARRNVTICADDLVGELPRPLRARLGRHQPRHPALVVGLLPAPQRHRRGRERQRDLGPRRDLGLGQLHRGETTAGLVAGLPLTTTTHPTATPPRRPHWPSDTPRHRPGRPLAAAAAAAPVRSWSPSSHPPDTTRNITVIIAIRG
jgi:hypothetical protein